MTTLTKGMYADYICNKFGLTYNQIRANSIMPNAGWFNLKGEKLGFGDLSMQDFDKIALGLEINEIFFALSEADTTWNMPSHLSINNPGINYVLNHAKWAVLSLPNHNHDIVQIVPNSQLTDLDEFFHTSKEDISFHMCSRESLIKELDFDGEKFLKIKPPVKVDRVFIGTYFGLDEYYLSDGTSWAVGNYNKSEEAARLVARKYIYTLNKTEMMEAAQSGFVSSVTWDIIASITEFFDYKGNEAIIKLIGDNNAADIAEKIRLDRGNGIVASFDQMIAYSGDIKCLPPGKYAYRLT